MSVALDIQGAVNAALRNSSGVTSLVGTEVFDRIPNKAAKPYIRIGDDQVIDDGNSCSDAYEIFVTIHIFSDAVGRVEAKRIAGAVREALATELTVNDHITVVGLFNDERYTDDPNPLVTHGILTFRYLVEPDV